MCMCIQDLGSMCMCTTYSHVHISLSIYSIPRFKKLALFLHTFFTYMHFFQKQRDLQAMCPVVSNQASYNDFTLEQLSLLTDYTVPSKCLWCSALCTTHVSCSADPLGSETALPSKGNKTETQQVSKKNKVDDPEVFNDDGNGAQGPPRSGGGGGDKGDEEGDWIPESNVGFAQLVAYLFAFLIGGLFLYLILGYT